MSSIGGVPLLNGIAQFTAHRLKRNNVELEQEIFVVEGLDKPLLRRPAIEGLKIVTPVGPVQAEESVVQKFPKLFQGLGRLKDNYTIKLRENAEPYALNTPRRVAIPLLPKVKAELERMESMGVISRVTEPTDWCAGMVVVPKSNGTVRICLDLTKLNESVSRERHIMPPVEQTLAQIGGATVFSKLDANYTHLVVTLFTPASVPFYHTCGKSEMASLAGLCPFPCWGGFPLTFIPSSDNQPPWDATHGDGHPSVSHLQTESRLHELCDLFAPCTAYCCFTVSLCRAILTAFSKVSFRSSCIFSDS